MIVDVLLSVVAGAWHVVTRRHVPRWAPWRYDGLGWSYRCTRCDPDADADVDMDGEW